MNRRGGGNGRGGYERRPYRQDDSVYGNKERKKPFSRNENKQAIKQLETKIERQEVQERDLQKKISKEKKIINNKSRGNEKKIREAEYSTPEKETVINPNRSKNVISNSATTAPATVEYGLPWFGFAVDAPHPANLVADVILADFVRAYPDVIDIITSTSGSLTIGFCTLKIYLVWVLLSLVDETGKLNGTKKYTIIRMGKHLLVPKAWARYCNYFCATEYEGARYSFRCAYDNDLVATINYITQNTGEDVGTGWPYDGTNILYNLFPKHENSAGVDYNFAATSLGIKTLVDVIEYSELISARLGSTGMCVPYGSIPRKALDYSAYASVGHFSSQNAHQSSMSNWFSKNFDPDMAALLRGNVNYAFHPITKNSVTQFVTYPRITNSSDTTYNQGGLWSIANTFAFVVNRMKNPFGRWNYQGTPLNTISGKYVRFDSASISSALFVSIAAFKEIYKSQDSTFSNFTVKQCQSMMVASMGAWYYRLSQTKPLCYGANEMRWLPSKVYSSLKLPPLVASVVEAIGPTVCDGTLMLPYPNQRENAGENQSITEYTVQDMWNILQSNAAAVTCNAWSGGIVNSLGIEMKATTTTWTIKATAINAAWIAANLARPAFPERTINDFLEPGRSLVGKTNMGDSLVSAMYGPFGSNVNQTQTLQDKELFDTAIVLGYVDANNYNNWNIWHACSRIDSPIPIGKKDLIMAQLLCVRPTSYEYSTGANYALSSPHQLLFDGHSPDFIESLKAVALASTQPGGSYLLALGEEREKMKASTINIGSLEIDFENKEECRSYWCRMFDTLLDAASTYLAGRGGEAYLAPKIMKEIESHAKNFVYQYTGDLGVVAATAVMKGVGVLLETGL